MQTRCEVWLEGILLGDRMVLVARGLFSPWFSCHKYYPSSRFDEMEIRLALLWLSHAMVESLKTVSFYFSMLPKRNFWTMNSKIWNIKGIFSCLSVILRRDPMKRKFDSVCCWLSHAMTESLKTVSFYVSILPKRDFLTMHSKIWNIEEIFLGNWMTLCDAKFIRVRGLFERLVSERLCFFGPSPKRCWDDE